MKKLLVFFLFQLVLISTVNAQLSIENDKDDLENLLHDFLRGASENNPEIHDRFWAEDLIYTSSNGERVTKKIIMDGLDDNNNIAETPDYHAEEIQIRLFDDMAVIAFKLVAVSLNSNGDEERLEFYNTGTFQKRNGQWKAVAWQATRIPVD